MRTFSKALSILLSIAMLLSMVSVSVFAQDVELIDVSDVEIVEAEEPVAEEPAEEDETTEETSEDEEVFLLGATDGLYVSYAGSDETGNGSEALPYRTIAKAQDNLGNLSKIYIVDSTYSITYGQKPENLVFYDAKSHTNTITYVGVSPDGKSGMGFAAGGGTMQINGPSVFENLTLVEGYGGWKLISLLNSGVNVTFDRVRVLPVRSGTTTQDSTPHRHDGMYLSQYGYWGNDVITFKNGDYGVISLSPSGNGGGNANATITVNVENASMTSIDLTKDSYEGISSGRYNNMSYKTLFINLDNAEFTNGIVQSGPVSVATIENLQVLAVNDTEIPTMSIDNAVITNKWIVKVNGGELVATTTPGTFTVPSGSTAYWFEDAKTVKYAKGTLTLEAGEYEINVTDSVLSDILEAPEAPEGQTFVGWVDDGKGTLSAQYITEVPAAIYVSHSLGNDETGDGTYENPYKTIGAARTAIGDKDGVIAIVDAVYTVTPGSTPDMLLWDGGAKGTNKITYVGVDPDGKSGIATGFCLSFNTPTVLKNLTVVLGYNKNNDWNSVYGVANVGGGTDYRGFQYELDDVKVIQVTGTAPITQDTEGPLSDKLLPSTEGIWGIQNWNLKNGTYGTFDFSPRNAASNIGEATFSLNITDAIVKSVNLGNTTKTGSFKALFINLDGESSLTEGITYTSTGVSSVAKLQILATNGAQVPAISDAARAITEQLWIISSNGKLEATTTAGKLTIPAGSTVYSYEDEYTVKYSKGDTITFENPGTYNVMVAEGDVVSALEIPEAPAGKVFAGWVDDGNGTITAKFYVSPGDGAIYVSHTSGNDEWDGITIATAKKTLKGAQAALNGEDGIICVIDSEYSVSSGSAPDMLQCAFDAHDNTITVVGLDADGKSGIASSQGFNTNGPTILKNLTILLGSMNNKEWNFFGAGNKAPGLGYSLDNVKVIQISGGTYTQNSTGPISDKLIAAPEGINRDGYKSYEFKNGTYGVFSIAAKNKEYVNSNIDVSVTDATLKALNIALGFDTWSNGVLPTSASISTLSVTLDGEAEITNGITYTSASEESSVQNIQVYAKNGATLPAVSAQAKAITDNIWLIEGEDGLGFTEIPGKLALPEGTTYKFTRTDGKSVVVSSETDYILQPGRWTAELVEVYEFDGEAITAAADVIVNLAELVPTQYADKTFVGWKNVNGDIPGAVAELAAGDTLVAEYIDFAAGVDEDFSVLGVEVRIQSDDNPMGMRYVSRLDKTYLERIIENSTDSDVLDFGSIILPEVIVDGRELVADGSYGYKGTDYEVDEVTAKPENGGMIKVYGNGYYDYTIVLTSIMERNYTRDYTVRSYVKFNDLNGVERYAYGESYTTSLFKVADYAIRNPKPGMTDAAFSTCESIVENVRAAADNGAQDDTLYLVFDPSKYTSSSSHASMTLTARKDLPEGYLSEENYKAGKIFYKTENNLRVREIHVPIPAELAAKNENIKTTIIAGLSDTHISGMTLEDRKDPELMATYNARTWARDGGNIPLASKAMSFASVYDQVLIPGDILDYMSQGAINNVKNYLLKPYPEKVMITLGNHDAHKNNQSGMPEGLPIAERQKIVESEYASVLGEDYNIYYSSEVIKDTVMAVILENGEMTFHQDQIEKLESDIKIARKNGYVMIVSLHVPVRTLDSTQNAVKLINPLFTSGENNALNFYDDQSKGLVMMPNNDVSRAVYKLITENADVIRAVYAGHKHADYTSYLEASYVDAEGNTVETTIPQYVCNSAVFSGVNTTAGVDFGEGNAVKFVFDVFEE